MHVWAIRTLVLSVGDVDGRVFLPEIFLSVTKMHVALAYYLDSYNKLSFNTKPRNYEAPDDMPIGSTLNVNSCYCQLRFQSTHS